MLIETTSDLETLCHTLENEPFVTIDSEFVREKTYFAKLCLIQVAWSDGAAIIDPLAPDINLSAFLDILQRSEILKVFHSGRQDIEIFYNLSGKVPSPIFDTQIAAMVCGFGNSISYGNLVQAICKVELDKSSRLTDWSKRPLEKHQLEYALKDVTYLVDCYKYLDNYLQEHKRQRWIKEELENLSDESVYKPDPDNAWLKIRHSIHSPQFLCVLKELAAWRELRAIKHNIPKHTILKDDMLVNIASIAPLNEHELAKVRNIPADVVKGKLGKEILEAVNRAVNMPFSNELKKLDKARQVQIPPSAAALVEVLKLLLKIKSEQNLVVSSLVADEQNLRDIACGNNDKTNPALLSWRYDIFGKYALAFRKGQAVIKYDTSLKDIVIDTFYEN